MLVGTQTNNKKTPQIIKIHRKPRKPRKNHRKSQKTQKTLRGVIYIYIYIFRGRNRAAPGFRWRSDSPSPRCGQWPPKVVAITTDDHGPDTQASSTPWLPVPTSATTHTTTGPRAPVRLKELSSFGTKMSDFAEQAVSTNINVGRNHKISKKQPKSLKYLENLENQRKTQKTQRGVMYICIYIYIIHIFGGRNRAAPGLQWQSDSPSPRCPGAVVIKGRGHHHR